MNGLLMCAALLGGLLSGPTAFPKRADVKAIQAVHSKLMAALKTRNAREVDSLFAKDFTETANGVTFNRQQALAQMERGAASASVRWTMSHLTVSGNRAGYTSHFSFNTSVVDRTGMMGAKGVAHRMSGSGVQMLQLVKQHGNWLYSHQQLISMQTMMDGKPLDRPGASNSGRRPSSARR